MHIFQLSILGLRIANAMCAAAQSLRSRRIIFIFFLLHPSPGMQRTAFNHHIKPGVNFYESTLTMDRSGR
jgi:hypothetical protein